MKPSRLLPSLSLSLLLIAAAQAQPAPSPAPAAPAAASSDASGSSTIKFSDPSKPGTLKVWVGRGSVHVVGADVADVEVGTKLQPVESDQRQDGLRVLSSSSNYSLTEKDNVVTLDYGHIGGALGADFRITVPRHTAVIIPGSPGSGGITCSNLDGNLEIKSLNGQVRLENIGGGALVEAINGGITADIRQLHAGQPLSFTSINGRVSIRLPGDAKANVQLRTRNGSILTDFDEKELVIGKADLTRDSADADGGAKADKVDKVNKAARTHHQGNDDDDDDGPSLSLPPVTGGKTVSGVLNGGGPEILAATMNGDVILRKLSSAPSQPKE